MPVLPKLIELTTPAPPTHQSRSMVIDVSKRFFPQMASGYADPRVSVHVCDGIKFVEEAAAGSYDVIVVDSSDPVGPAEVLFQRVRRGRAAGGGVGALARRAGAGVLWRKGGG